MVGRTWAERARSGLKIDHHLLPSSLRPGSWPQISPTWHDPRWVLISSLAFSTAHIQVFPGQEHTLLSPALLALEPSGSFLESLDTDRNRMAIFACQEEGSLPLQRVGKEAFYPTVFNRAQ